MNIFSEGWFLFLENWASVWVDDVKLMRNDNDLSGHRAMKSEAAKSKFLRSSTILNLHSAQT